VDGGQGEIDSVLISRLPNGRGQKCSGVVDAVGSPVVLSGDDWIAGEGVHRVLISRDEFAEH
jgi:hypothetical protein